MEKRVRKVILRARKRRNGPFGRKVRSRMRPGDVSQFKKVGL